MSKNSIILAIVAILVVGAFIYVNSKISSLRNEIAGANLGTVSNVTTFDALGAAALQVGSGCSHSLDTCTGTQISQLNTGICYIDPYAATIPATSTVAVDCQGTMNADVSGSSALTGVAAWSTISSIQAQLATTTAKTTFGGISIDGASASTTAGHIQLLINNHSGGVYTWSTTAGTASGTASYIVTSQ